MRYYYLASSILMTDLVLYSLSVCLEKKGGHAYHPPMRALPDREHLRDASISAESHDKIRSKLVIVELSNTNEGERGS